MIRGTIEINSNGEKVFLPELICDIFIGICKPNQYTIDNDSFRIVSDINSKENDIVYAEINYKENTCILLKKEI